MLPLLALFGEGALAGAAGAGAAEMGAAGAAGAGAEAAAGAGGAGGLSWSSLQAVKPKSNGTRGRSVLDWKSLTNGLGK